MATLSTDQRTALLDQLTHLVKPYLPTKRGKTDDPVEFATALLANEKVRQQCLALRPNVDFTALSADDTRRLDDITRRGVVARMSASDDGSDGLLVAKLSEQERAIVERILMQAMPDSMIESMATTTPGVTLPRTIARELVVNMFMAIDTFMEDILEFAFSDLTIADMTEDDETTTVAAIKSKFAELEEQQTSSEEPKKAVPVEERLAALSAEERAAVKGVIALVMAFTDQVGLFSQCDAVEFGRHVDIWLANHKFMQCFFSATEGVNFSDEMSEPEQKAIAQRVAESLANAVDHSDSDSDSDSDW